MQRKRMLGLAGATAMAVVLVATAGAGAKPVGVRKIDLSTRAAVANYLHSIGVSPKGVVIQRGRFNYAGPNCPGRRWKCTTSHRVVQVATDDGENSFQCTDNTVSPPDCMIVQSSPKRNRAVCHEHIETAGPTADEHCSIDQTGPDNRAKVDMIIVMHGSPSQNAMQGDDVRQRNTDPTKNGHNDSDVKLRIVQHTGGGEGSGAYSAAADTTSQDQQTQQDTSVDQFDLGAGTNDSEASSTFLQVAKAAPDTTSQTQNTSGSPNNKVGVLQNNNGGSGDSDLDIHGRSLAIGPNGEGNGEGQPAAADTGPLHQTQGSPTGGLMGQSDQSSHGGESALTHTRPGNQKPGKLTLDATINEDMIAIGDPGTIQEQHGPTVCCSTQSGNPQLDHETIREDIHLFKNSNVGEQTDLNLLDCHSDNHFGCDGQIHTNVNGNKASANCLDNVAPCDIGVACASSIESACVPIACGGNTEINCECVADPTSCEGASPRQSGASFARRE